MWCCQRRSGVRLGPTTAISLMAALFLLSGAGCTASAETAAPAAGAASGGEAQPLPFTLCTSAIAAEAEARGVPARVADGLRALAPMPR